MHVQQTFAARVLYGDLCRNFADDVRFRCLGLTEIRMPCFHSIKLDIGLKIYCMEIMTACCL